MSTVEEVRDVISQPETTIMFMARRRELRLTMRPRYPIRDTLTGAQSGTTQGMSIGFRDGVLRVAKEGMVQAEDTLDAGSWEMPADEVLAWLRKHRLFGNVSEGFWEVDATAPPVSPAEMEALQDAALALDRVALQTIIDTERAGWERESILRIAEGTLAKVQGMEAAAAEKAAEDHAAQVKAQEDAAAEKAIAAKAAAAKKAGQ